MKIKVDYFLINLIKQNLIYIITFIILIIGFSVSMVILLNRYRINRVNINKTKTEIERLKKKLNLINYKQEIISEGIDLDSLNNILSRLIPNEEDFFSIIYALEQISKKTGFIITSYTINFEKTTANRISLVVEGEGNQESFFKFLENYRYLGGRLITIDKIDYSKQEITTAKLSINFYNGKEGLVTTETEIKLDQFDKKLVKEIMDKITFNNQVKEEDFKITPYPVKNDFF